MSKRPVRPLARGVSTHRVTHQAKSHPRKEHTFISRNADIRQAGYPHKTSLSAKQSITITARALLQWAELALGANIEAFRQDLATEMALDAEVRS
jgi:hypothetical protein